MSKDCDAGCVYRRGHPGPCTVDALAALYDPKRYEHIKPDVSGRADKYMFPPDLVVTRSRADVAAMYDGPRPAGVTTEYVSPTDTHPAVGVATVDGKATCPKCPESIESRATYARVPAHAGPTPAEAAIFERGGYVPMLPPIADLVTPKNKALLEKHGAALEAACREVAQDERCEAGCSLVLGHVGRCITERGALRSHPMPNVTADAVASVATTPAAMLGEAQEHIDRAVTLLYRAQSDCPWSITAFFPLVSAADAVRRDKRKADMSLANCPRGIHDGPGSDACDCAAIAKAEAER